MSSLRERIELLESDLLARPPRITVHSDLPFAILRYGPEQEWELRREIRLFAVRLEQAGKKVHSISMAELLWQSIDETEGLEAVVGLERERGYLAAQEQVPTYLADADWRPLANLLLERLVKLDASSDVAFLTRVAVMSPAIYYVHQLLNEIHGQTRVPTILFYPGSIEGTTRLRFMDRKDRDALGDYRVKIYG